MNSSIILVALLCSIVTAHTTPSQLENHKTNSDDLYDDSSLPFPGQDPYDNYMNGAVDIAVKMYSDLEKQHPNFLPYQAIFDGLEADRAAKNIRGFHNYDNLKEDILELLENSLDYASSSAPSNISSEEVHQFAKTFVTLLSEIVPDYPKHSTLLEGLAIVHHFDFSYGYKKNATSIENFHSLLRKAVKYSWPH